MPKVIEKIREKQQQGEKFYSLEFFPPRTEVAANNLFALFDRFSEGQPLFIDITWGAGGGNPSSEEVATSSLSVAASAINYCGLSTMLHLTCTYMSRDECRSVLNRAKDLGICNILALRGDRPEDGNWTAPENGFTYCSDLVRFIREEFGNHFCICVAGYPNGHPDSPTLESDIFYLKEKVDAGADFIITQLFFESQVFFEFYDRCRKIGIECPIIPGILPIQGYASIRHLIKLSKIKPPTPILNRIEEMKDDDKAIRDYGVEVSVNMCKELMNSNIDVPGFHFYTLNREVAVINILKEIGMWNDNSRKELPWALISANDRRSKELVRPIFWAGRPKSYLIRTRDWNEFPNGRWGDSTAPAFGDLKGYYLFKDPELRTKQSLREMWGTPLHIDEVNNVFVRFLSGSENERVNHLPWSERAHIASETSVISSKLIWLNENGILTTNSQPSVNGKPSSDPVFGWGPEGGYIYQKAYLEFFISPRLFSALTQILNDKSKFPHIQYHAVNVKGEEIYYPPSHKTTAVTWGVFPGSEIIQPTVVDPESFLIWKDEAFGLWKSEWGSIYEKGSPSYNVIQEIYDTYWLVNIVDNDFINGDIFKPFSEILPPYIPSPRANTPQ